MSTPQDHPKAILAGVDGSPADEAVLRYAADVAARTGADVRLVHVATSYSAMLPVIDVDFDGLADETMSVALTRAKELVDPAKVTGEVLHGQRHVALLEAAKEVDLVLLGTQHRSRLERLITGSTVTALAAQAPCNVVVVPDTYTGNVHGRVGVGVKTLEGAPTMVTEAARIAAGRGASLEVLHSWHLPVSAYDALTLPGTIDTEAWAEDMQVALADGVEAALGTHPDVEVVQTVVEGYPTAILEGFAERIDLLVMARRTHAFPRGHLGGTARHMLHEAPCPVVVVPPQMLDEEGMRIL